MIGGASSVVTCLRQARQHNPNPFYDAATGQTVTVNIETWCREVAELSPDPKGELVMLGSIRNGYAHADYFRSIRTEMVWPNGVRYISVTSGERVPDDEARR